MAKLIAKQKKENIVYMSEHDARAIGIIEGFNQSVTVDGKQIDLVFCDEHDFLEPSSDEKRIINNSLNSKGKQLSNKGINSLVPYSNSANNYDSMNIEQPSKSGSSIFDSLKTFFGKRHKGNNRLPERSAINSYQNRTDIFTNEEVELIQEVIYKAQGEKSIVRSTKPKKTVAKKTAKAAKSTTAKPKKVNGIEVTKKHIVIKSTEIQKYNYDKRRKQWHTNAGYNEVSKKCSSCKTPKHASVTTDDSRDICYNCFIKKPKK